MRHLLIASLLWFVFTSCARATSVELPVSATNLDTSHFTFSVSTDTNATKDAVAFHVTITSKQSDIYPDSRADVDRVVHQQLPNGSRTGSVGPAQPPIPISLKKEKRVWTADFTVPRERLHDPDLCFVFSVLAHTNINGKEVAMPSATFYELRLKDFVKPSWPDGGGERTR